MAKKTFKIRARLVFSGEVSVRANSRQDAERIAESSISARLGEVQNQDEDAVVDFEFSTKSETVVKRREEAVEE